MRVVLLSAVAAISLGFSLPTLAQEASEEVPVIAPEDVSVGQIVSFVNAMIVAERVRQQYLAKIELAESEEEIEALVAEADQQGMAEVDRVPGITAAEYQAISLAARDSEDLSRRISMRFQELMSSQGIGVRQKPAEDTDGAETDGAATE